MSNPRLLLFPAALACSSVLCSAQSLPSPPRLTLRVGKEIPIQGQFASPIMVPVRCDADGNIYLRFYRFPSPLSASFTRVSNDGKKITTYATDSVPDLKKSQSYDFAVSFRGDFFLLVTTGRGEGNPLEVAVVSFDRDGTFKSKVNLEISGTLVPSKLIVFPSGNFLVTGRLATILNPPEVPAPGNHFEPFTGIFDGSGRLVKRITLPGDVEPHVNNSQHGGGQQSPETTSSSLEEISLGQIALGDDGLIYIMRRTQKPKVYVLTQLGDVVRHFEVDVPSNYASPQEMQYGTGGKLAFLFTEQGKDEKSQRITFAVVDAQNGHTEAYYDARPNIGAAFACYGPGGFTMLGSTEDGHLAIKTAKP
jgi:hypothetical protein